MLEVWVALDDEAPRVEEGRCVAVCEGETTTLESNASTTRFL